MASSKKKGGAGIRSTASNEQNKSSAELTNTAPVKPVPGVSAGKGFDSIPLYSDKGAIQAKFSVNEPGDQYEQEADNVADKILRSGEDLPPQQLVRGINLSVQAKRGDGGTVSESLSSKISSTKGSGVSLDNETQSFMSGRFGVDFSSVKIHADDESTAMNSEINAKAFTAGNDIYFNKEKYKPSTQDGKQLLAHELTHVVQQQGLVNKQAAIQKDEDADSGNETEARLNFKNDWENNFSRYKDLIKGATIVYDEKLKGNIKAVKSGQVMTITLGKAFATETDERTRWQWIKAEIVDQFSKVDLFEDVAYDPTHSKLNQINPPYRVGQYCHLNCPASAAALDEYLRTGNINKAYCEPVLETKGGGYGFDVSMNTFSKSFPKWKSAEAEIRKQLKAHGSFLVVEATRSAEQMQKENLAEFHYFIVANVKGSLFVLDAFGGGIVDNSLSHYVDFLKVTSFRIVKGQFKVKPVIVK